MHLEKGIEDYLQWKNSHRKIAASRYRIRLLGFQRYLGKDTPLSAITGDQIVQYHLSIENQYSPATIAYSARILKNFFDFWRGRGEARLNPKEIIATRFIAPAKDFATREDLEDMSDLLDERYFDDLVKKLILHLLWDTGMRVSELCEIKIDDIQKNETTGLWFAKVRSRKSMRYNLVVWSRETNDILTKYLGVHLALGKSSDYLLTSRKNKNNQPLNARSVQRWIKSLCQQAMLDKNITPHSFRHGKAHDMLDKGANVRDVQAILRHVKPESSFHYMTLNPQKYLTIAQKYL